MSLCGNVQPISSGNSTHIAAINTKEIFMPLSNRTNRMAQLGSVSGIGGALLLALNTGWSPYGWLSFLLSNLCWICYAHKQRIQSMLVMQLVFMLTSVLGIYRWLV